MQSTGQNYDEKEGEAVNTIQFKPPNEHTAPTPPVHQQGQNLSFNEVEAVDIAVRNLSVTVRQQDQEHGSQNKQILDGISCNIPSGTLMAIIGGSGSGKTTLLNVMANRIKPGTLNIEGCAKFNGHSNLSKIRHAYVLQQDLLLPSLTCRETLIFSADLRLPSTTSKDERRRLVDEVILELGLKDCADTIVGDHEHRGLSGGEKRRLSIGVQLLANPSILFLDEPTTGLDAYSAQLLVKTLQKLSRKGRTIIASIHQPRSDIFFLFDSITLLTQGRSVYSGSVYDSMAYFSDLGLPFPEHINPADYLIDITAFDSRSVAAERESGDRINTLVSAWRERVKFDPVQDRPEPEQVANSRVHLIREIVVLVGRTFKITYRDTLGLVAAILEAIFMGIIAGWIFYQADSSLLGIRSTLGALYSANGLQGYLILMYETYRLSAVDMCVFDRERKDGMVSVSGFLISRRIARLATEDVACPLLFSVISYFMVGLKSEAGSFFIYFLNVMLQQWVSVCVATMCVAISRDYAQSSLIANMVYTIQVMSCGFFNQAGTMPVYVRWIKWIAYVYYGLGVLVSNQFTGYFGDCPYGDETDAACVQYTGKYQLDALGFPEHWIAVPLVAILGLAVWFYVMAWLILTYRVVDVSVAAPKTQSIETSLEKSEEYEPKERTQPIQVEVADLHLGIQKRNIYLKVQNIQILQAITACFEPGKINAIMGPSGSGKSSLLNHIAFRMHSGLFSRYYSTGSVLFGGRSPTPSVVRSICSYVTQEDDGLLPALTVRETLQFAADLRLPQHLSKRQKRARVEEIILKMGLKYCANTLIGSDLVKGISGGERRRVSISIQLLNEPKVLLLDEPTSGLDSFTAASILNVLKGLAEEGRTVVCTIHQPRSDLFYFFGNILLLAKGGHVAYSGPGSERVLEYFKDCGYPCPKLTNPADHILDLVSVNLQDPENEAFTRMRVQTLLDQYNLSLKYSSSAISSEGKILQAAEIGSLQRKQASFTQAFPILVHRGILNVIRRPTIVVARFGQIVGFGAILALFFSPLKHDYYGAMNRVGIIQQSCALYFIGMLNNIAAYPEERNIFYCENDDGVYGVAPFLASYSFFEVPLEILNGLLFSTFVVIVTGLRRSADTFFVTAYVAFVVVNCGESIGIAFNTLFRHTGFAANMTSVVLTIGTSMIISLHMPGFLRAVNYVNPLKYTAASMLNYGFKGLKFTCDDSLRLANGQCPFSTGEAFLETYDYVVNKPAYLGAMLAVTLVYRILASLFLKLMRL